MRPQPLLNLLSNRLHALPVVILYITDRCNARCISCDYWRFGQKEMSMELIETLVCELPGFGTRYLLLSGGEPLQHGCWDTIARRFKRKGIRVGMATSGILLPKHAAEVADSIDELFVSLDGANPDSYKSIRGVDAFGVLEEGIGRLAGRLPVTFRTTVQRGNYREIPDLIRLSRSWGAAHHSFQAVDVNTRAAFGRKGDFDRSMALTKEDLEPFARVLLETEREFKVEYDRGYMAESRDKMRQLHSYFAALLGERPFPKVRCNAPRFSAVIAADGSLKPCFFLPASGRLNASGVWSALNTRAGVDLRALQARGEREECRRCVCPAYRGIRSMWEGS